MADACPRCGVESPPGARFCAVCGAPLAGCPSCGAALPSDARFCPSCGRAVDGREPAGEPAEERKLVTVVFADLVGSTAIADGRDPERVGQILGAYASAVREVIEGWGGTVEKFIGDAVVGAFGVPATHEDDAARAIHAAREIQARVAALNADLEAAHGVRLAVRIGVNTGEVLAATSAGLDQRFMAGDVVNVAARLQGAADAGDVLVSARTAERAGDAFSFASAEALDVKGKERPVSARRLMAGREAVREPASRPAAVLQAPLVGRERELRSLRETLGDVVDEGKPHMTLVFGPAGIGKSRLIREFIEGESSSAPAPAVLRGRCLAAGREVTYWALGEIVRAACDISLDEPGDGAFAKLCATTAGLFEGGATEPGRVRDVQFALATTANIQAEGNPLDRMRPVAVAAALGRAWPQFVSARARHAPTILFVEDLHWADEQLLAMLQNIARRSAGPVHMIATARPEFAEDHPEFGTVGETTTSITLTALRESDAERMAGALLGTDRVPASLRETILDRAEGNPFFVEQLVADLIDDGVLVQSEGAWRMTEPGAAARIPDTIQGVLAARIDRLPGSQKKALQEAAVVGRAFWPSALAASMDEPVVAPALDALEAKSLVVARERSSIAGEAEFAFKHALVRDVAYAGIPLARRARSHARAAEWMEGLRSEGDDALLEPIAHHYRAALLGDGSDLAWRGEPATRAAARDRAFPALIAAGSSARRRNAIERGLEFHQAALELAVSDEERARAFEEIGDDHGWSYHGDQSTEAWDRALELWRALGDDEACARVCLKAARHTCVYWGGFATRPPGATVDRYASEGIERTHNALTRSQLLALKGLARATYTSLGEKDPLSQEERIDAAQEAAAIADELGSDEATSLALRSLSELYLDAGRTDDALALVDRQVDVAGRLEVLRDRMLDSFFAGEEIMDLGGDLERALDLAWDIRRLASDSSPHERMHASYLVMSALYRLGRWQEILPLIEEHMTAFAEETVDMNCPFTRGGPVVGALTLELMGRPDEAAEVAKSIFPNPEEPGLVEGWMAERALLGGEPAAALDIARQTVAFGRGPSIEQPFYELAPLVEALAELGRWDELSETLPGVRAREANLVWIAPAIDRAEAMRLGANGDTAGARTALHRALDEYRRLRMPLEVARTLERLADLDPGEAAAASHRAEAAAIRASITASPT
ncbi:MAG TPA: adenylate/guanylate cyclase domain-containing protein [Actinomycetota bacterium]|nr:adenylate/guanylate cyclase domain-containing protein [Actinomycetota bacterium]